MAGVVAAVVAVGIVAAVVVYLVVVPGMLASGYKERAEPEHEKAEKALEPAYDTFSRETFSYDISEIEKAEKPGEYVRAVSRVSARVLKKLGRTRRTVKRAQADLEEVDADQMTEAPDWPLLGGRGELKEAESIASDEGDYVRKGEKFLRDYLALVDYEIDSMRFFRRVGITIGRGSDAIPENATSPGQITRPVKRSIRQVESQLRRFRKTKPPKARRAEHKNVAQGIDFIVDELTRFTKAIERLDLAAAEQVDRRLARGAKRFDRRSQANFRELISRSVHVRQINDLERRERELKRAYEKLASD